MSVGFHFIKFRHVGSGLRTTSPDVLAVCGGHGVARTVMQTKRRHGLIEKGEEHPWRSLDQTGHTFCCLLPPR